MASSVVTAADDKTARLWDSATGKPLATLIGHEGDVMSAAFSPDGKQVVTATLRQRPRGSGTAPPASRWRPSSATKVP